MLGKVQRLYWRFVSWLYLKHPKVLENGKKFFPKGLKDIIKRFLAKDKSIVYRKIEKVEPKKGKLSVSVYAVGPSKKEGFLDDQTVFSLISEVVFTENLNEAFVKALKSKSEYIFFCSSEDALERNALEKALIRLESRHDLGFALLSGALTQMVSKIGAVNFASNNLLARSIFRKSYLESLDVLDLLNSPNFFENYLPHGLMMEEQTFVGRAYLGEYRSQIDFRDLHRGIGAKEARKRIKNYQKNLKSLSKSSILENKKPFERLGDTKLNFDFDKKKKTILFAVPWTVVGGSDKVLLDLLGKIKEQNKYNTVVVTTFDVSSYVGENIWEENFKEKSDYFYPGYSFCEYEQREELLKYLITKVKPDLIVISNTGHGYNAVNEFEIPVIDIHHGELFMEHATGAKGKIQKHIAVSGYVRDLLTEKYKIQENDVKIIPNGVDENIFGPTHPKDSQAKELRRLLGLGGSKVMIYIGRLGPEKNPLLALKTLKGLKKEGLDVKLLVLGDGPEKGKMLNFCQKEAIIDDVLFEGFRNDTSKYLSVADFLILPSIKEAFGIVAVEALMSGVPVLASDIGELSKIVMPGANGYLAQSENEGDFTEKAAELLGNLASLKKKARASVVEKYGLTKTSSDYFDLMDEVISDKRKS